MIGLAAQFENETGFSIAGEFSAVGRMNSRLRNGTPADAVILTSAVIEELTRDGHVLEGSAVALGTVQTGVAVRCGDQAPRVDTTDTLRNALLAANEIFIPDFQQATAGIHFAKVLERLGLRDALQPRLRTDPNGATAMRTLAATGGRPIGCTQATEILATPGVRLVGPLPRGFELDTIYSAAVHARAADPAAASDFVRLLTGAESRERRAGAGFRET